MKRILRRLTNSGTQYTNSKSEKRNVIMTNYTSLVASIALLILIPSVFFYYDSNTDVLNRLLIASVLFLIPFALNRFGYILLSRVILSWLTPVIVFGVSILDLKAGEQMSSSSFVGLRLFLMAGFCFPFLIFNLKNKRPIILALSVSVLSFIFFDRIFIFFDVDFEQIVMQDPFYSFNNMRTMVTTLAIGSTLFFLKSVVEKNEEWNRQLLNELEVKNKLIRQQAEAEVYKLNEKLTANLQLLRVSEERYRSLFEQASDFIAILDFNGNFIDANESWCSTFGYSKEELMNLKIEDLIDPNQLANRPLMYTEIQRGEHLFSHRRMKKRDKSVIDVESNVKKLQADKMQVIGRDVTKLVEAQHQIQVSEAKFRSAFEHSAIGMALVSTDSKWLQVNKELCQIVGYSEDELLHKPSKDITHPEDVSGDHEFQQQLLRGAQDTFQREKRYLHRDGSVVWVNLNASIVKDADGLPLYFVAQIENITMEKKAAEQLMIQEANLKATINNTEVMIWSVDTDFKLLMFNIQFANYMLRNYGIQLKIGIGILSTLQSPIFDELRNKWRPLYLQALEGKRITFEETRFGIDLQYSLSPIIEMDKVIGVSIFADNVSERVARDRELAEANKKIGELKLMALRSVMSPHFIFNVLNSIQFFIAKSDRLNAMNYLATFSKLIRSILYHSVNNKIKLADEIELLQNYVNLEMTRFENKFAFSLLVDPEIEIESIVIPSLLIQPYVENAILHGLYNKQGHGELFIRINENDGILIFEIEDNGIGRKESKKLRKYNFDSHASMGSTITEERLKLINQGNKSSFEIEDIMGKDGVCGTVVRIKIPYEPV